MVLTDKKLISNFCYKIDQAQLSFPFSDVGKGSAEKLGFRETCYYLDWSRCEMRSFHSMGKSNSSGQLLFFWLCHIARGILVPQPGVETVTPAVKAWSQPLDCQGILRPPTLVVWQNILWSVPEVSIRRQNLGPALGILSSKCDQVWLNPDLNLAAINWLADINSVSSSGLTFPVVVVYSLSCVQLLFDPNNCSPPCSFVHGISKARGFFTTELPGKTCISSTHLQNKNARGLKHATSQCADVKSTT